VEDRVVAVTQPPDADVTRLLVDWEAGDRHAEILGVSATAAWRDWYPARA
jgi:hypothetical protein